MAKRGRGRPKNPETPRLPPPMERDEIDQAPSNSSAINELLSPEKRAVRNSDFRMLEMAAAKFDVSQETKRKLVARMDELLDGDPKSRIGAARVLVAADRNDIQRDGLALKIEQADNPVDKGVTINVQINQKQAELAAIAAEIRAAGMAVIVQPGATISDSRSIDGTVEAGTDGDDGS